MSYQGSRGFIEVFDEFDHDSIGTGAGDGIVWLNSSDGGTAFAQNAGVVGGEGTAQGLTAATDNHTHELAHGSLMWRAQLDCMMETRVQYDVITTLAYNIGFNDDALDDSNTLPVELSTTTFTTNAGTWAGFVYDVDATNDDLHVFTVNGDSDNASAIADLRMSSAVPVAATYGLYVVQLYRGASATATAIAEWTAIPDESSARTQFRKRSGQGSLAATSVDGDADLTPHIGFENRDAVAHQCDVDYILVRQRRPQD